MKARITTSSWSAMDTFKAIKSTALAETVGRSFTVEAIAVGTDISAEDGKEIKAGYLRDSDGIMYSTVSKTTIQQLEALIELIESNGAMAVKVMEQTCKKDTKNSFIYLDLV